MTGNWARKKGLQGGTQTRQSPRRLNNGGEIGRQAGRGGAAFIKPPALVVKKYVRVWGDILRTRYFHSGGRNNLFYLPSIHLPSFNPLALKSDQLLTFPYSVFLKSNVKIMGIQEMTTNLRSS